MHLDRKTGQICHQHFTDILRWLHPGDCLVINDTKVIPARLFGRKEDTDAHIEILLLKRRGQGRMGDAGKAGEKGETRDETDLRRRQAKR